LEATTPLITSKLQQALGDAVLGTHAFRGDETVVVKRESIVPAVTMLRDDPELAMNFLMDRTITDYLMFPANRPVGDYPGAKDARFEVVYHFYSLTKGHRFRLKAPVATGESVDTLSGLYASADWMEREAWEMYGVKFAGHPNLKRLLTHQDFVGYPLRKDFPLKKRQPLSETDTLMDEMEQRLHLKGLK
jgi:NADH:ubiquinone oxidoreductase subunit C